MARLHLEVRADLRQLEVAHRLEVYFRPATVCAWTSPMVLAAAQFELAPPTVSSTNRTAGPGGVAAGAGVPKLRLLYSPVKP